MFWEIVVGTFFSLASNLYNYVIQISLHAFHVRIRSQYSCFSLKESWKSQVICIPDWIVPQFHLSHVKLSFILWLFIKSVTEFCISLNFSQKLVVKAVSLAIARDGASGGVVRTVTVSIFLMMNYAFCLDSDSNFHPSWKVKTHVYCCLLYLYYAWFEWIQ